VAGPLEKLRRTFRQTHLICRSMEAVWQPAGGPAAPCRVRLRARRKAHTSLVAAVAVTALSH